MDPRELLQRRTKLIAENRSLLELLKKQNRDWTAEEKEQYDKRMAEIHSLQKRAEAIEARRWEDAGVPPEERARHGIGRGAMDPQDHPGRGGSPLDRELEVTGFVDQRTGQPVPVIGPGQRLYEVRAREGFRSLPSDVRPADLSLGRWFRGLVTGDWTGAEAEQRAQRAQVGGVDVQGGYLVPEPLALQVIDLARNRTRVLAAGARTTPMRSRTLDLARVTKDPEARWKSELGKIHQTDIEFGRFTLTAHVLAAMVRLSVEVTEDAENISELVGSGLASALALELDRACLYGDGVGKPIGLRHDPQVGVIADLGVNGAALENYDPFSRAWQAVQMANGPEAGLGILLSPRTSGDIDRLKDSQGNPLRPPESWGQMRKFTTNQIPDDLVHGTSDDTSEAFVGAFREYLIGMRTELRIEVSQSGVVMPDEDPGFSAFEQLGVVVRAWLRADAMALRPDWFLRIPGIRPAGAS